MTSSLCPHLVQEYFERVCDILTVYRAQILKQVEYDKISENLVLRGAVRQEEHQKIFQCFDAEAQVSQMLVVIQNRMWGLENLLAALMEEHVSSWLTQELFRAYMAHLVNPLRKQRDDPNCQCVQLPNSILYRGLVKALKSLDSFILTTGTSLGFVNQTMYPADNMLAFLSDKLAEYTGGDSSSIANRDDMVSYGFAPNTSGEVQVAELEEDDINDLISLSETLCIAYHTSSRDENTPTTAAKDGEHAGEASLALSIPHQDSVGGERGFYRKSIDRRTMKKRESSSLPTTLVSRSRRKESYSSETELVDSEHYLYEGHAQSDNVDKLTKQRELIARLSAPKSTKILSAPSFTHLRHSPSDNDYPADPKNAVSTFHKQRPKSAEFQHSISVSCRTAESSSNENRTTSGKTKGFLRSNKNPIPASPKSKGRQLLTGVKPTAVAKPTLKRGPTKTKSLGFDEQCSSKEDKAAGKAIVSTQQSDHEDDFFLKNTTLFKEEIPINNTERGDLFDSLSEMSSLLLGNAVIAGAKEKTKSLTYYQLNFDNYSDTDNH